MGVLAQEVVHQVGAERPLEPEEVLRSGRSGHLAAHAPAEGSEESCRSNGRAEPWYCQNTPTGMELDTARANLTTSSIPPEHSGALLRGTEHPLLAVLRGDSSPTLKSEDESEQLTLAATYHGVVLPLYRAYVRGELGSSPMSDLAELAKRRRAGALKISVSAVEVSDWLRQEGVHHAILKGPAVAIAYESADREYTDLDVLVSPAQMQQAIVTLEHHGLRPLLGIGWPRPDGIGELPYALPRKVTVDLHADVVHHADVRRDFRLSAESLLERATSACILGRELPVLDPEDNLIHVALHAMISGGDRLVWLVDLDALLRQERISWPRLVARADDTRTALVVGVMLARTTRNLNSPVPRNVLRVLERRGRIWAGILRLFERWRPTAANYGHSFHGQVLMRATRDSTNKSLAILVRLIWTDIIVFVIRDTNHPWRVRLRKRWGRG